MHHESQLTHAPHGHILTNAAVWSPDSRWVVYDVRSDPAGSVFDGPRIERVHRDTGEVQVLYEVRHGARCGVATCSPVDDRVVFILGPEHPTPDWTYGPARRQGVVVHASRPGHATPLEARDLTPPFTPGALRGGTHVHVFSPDGRRVSFTYDDHLLETPVGPPGREPNARQVGVCATGAVTVPRTHPRNHDGSHFAVLVTRSVTAPRPGSDEIGRAFEDAWVGAAGYRRGDGTWQRHALAFLGEVAGPDLTTQGRPVTELFVADLPDDLTRPGDGPLEGTTTTRPRPPLGTAQRRLTFTADQPRPGLRGPRHWPRSSPDGERIAFLREDESGIVQLWTVSPRGGPARPLSRDAAPVASAFTWSPDGRWLAHHRAGSVCVTDADSGATFALTPPRDDLRPEACVVSPDGTHIAYTRHVPGPGGTFNQIFTVRIEDGP